MTAPFVDGLPLDGEVMIDGNTRGQYRGYLNGETGTCAVQVLEGPLMDKTLWFERSRLAAA